MPNANRPSTSRSAVSVHAADKASATPEKVILRVERHPDESKAAASARFMVRPEARAGLTLLSYTNGVAEVDADALVDELTRQCQLVASGDLSRNEALLTSQAHTLDAIFNSLVRKAHLADYLSQSEVYLRLALKTQSQCRATAETLAAIKNPRSFAFVKQANIAHGPQQVNNTGASTPQPMDEPSSRPRNPENEQIKLLEHSNGERLDGRTTSPAGQTNPPMAAVGAIHRSANARRQVARGSQRLQGRREAEPTSPAARAAGAQESPLSSRAAVA